MSVQSAGVRQDSSGAALSRALSAAAQLRTGVRRRRAVRGALLVAVLTLIPAAQAQADPTAIARISCTDSHRIADDPIVYPGQPGASHMHEFTGSWSTNAHSTEAQMRASGHTCGEDGDTAGYWTPTMHRPDGTLIRKVVTTAYYVGTHKDHTKIVPFPPGLKMIADMSTSLEHGSGYHCGNSRTPTSDVPVGYIPTCPTENKDRIAYPTLPEDTRVEAKIVFPDCMKSLSILDSSDHRSHMAYSIPSTKSCPASHPVSVPRLNLKQIYETFGGPDITLSSGAPETYHADFWNTWEQPKLDEFVRNCINTPDGSDVVCGDGLDERRWENPNYPKPTPAGSVSFGFPPPDDQLNPTNVTLSGLAAGSTVSGTKTLTATAEDNMGVSRVEFIMDTGTGYKDDDDSVGGHEVGVDNTAPYSFDWKTACLPNGKHTMLARAVDKIGRARSSAPIEVTTSNSSGCSGTTPPPPPPPPPAPPPAGDCDGGTTATGTIGSTGGTVSPSTGDFTTTASGTLKGCLAGDTSADFSLTLRRVNSDGSTTTVASSVTDGTSTENVSYNATAGKYRWRIQAVDGPGSYTFKQKFGDSSTQPPARCADAIDNDLDGLIDMDDSGCSSTTDDDEYNAPPADTTPPDTMITSGPSGSTSDNTPTFEFTVSESGSAFECKLNSAAYAPCTSPTTTSTLADGSYTFYVRAIDAAGNVDGSPATRAFTVSAATSATCATPTITYTGRLGGTGKSSDHTFKTTRSGAIIGCLTGTVPDLTLVLKKSIDGSWREVANSATIGTSNETITYSSAPGSYRWTIRSAVGSGRYTLKAVYP